METEGSLPHSQLPVSQPNPVHTSTSHFLKIHLNIIFSSTPRPPQWSLSLRFPHQIPVHTSPRPHPRYMPRLSHSSPVYNSVLTLTNFTFCFRWSSHQPIGKCSMLLSETFGRSSLPIRTQMYQILLGEFYGITNTSSVRPHQNPKINSDIPVFSQLFL
jgi:hypothetical protein